MKPHVISWPEQPSCPCCAHQLARHPTVPLGPPPCSGLPKDQTIEINPRLKALLENDFRTLDCFKRENAKVGQSGWFPW